MSLACSQPCLCGTCMQPCALQACCVPFLSFALFCGYNAPAPSSCWTVSTLTLTHPNSPAHPPAQRTARRHAAPSWSCTAPPHPAGWWALPPPRTYPTAPHTLTALHHTVARGPFTPYDQPMGVPANVQGLHLLPCKPAPKRKYLPLLPGVRSQHDPHASTGSPPSANARALGTGHDAAEGTT